jgi:hypothetical protein
MAVMDVQLSENRGARKIQPVDLATARLCSLRHLNWQLAANPKLVTAFWNEIAGPFWLTEPDITVLYSFLRHGSQDYVVMEYVAGETMEQLVKRMEPSRVEEGIPLFCQVLDAFEAQAKTTWMFPPTTPVSEPIQSSDFGILRVAGPGNVRAFGTVIFGPDGSLVEQFTADGARGQEAVFPLLRTVLEKLVGARLADLPVSPAVADPVAVRPVAETPQIEEPPMMEVQSYTGWVRRHEVPEPRPSRPPSMAWSLAMIGIAVVTALLVFFGAINAADYLSQKSGHGEPDAIETPASAKPAKRTVSPRKADTSSAGALRPEVLTSLNK